MPTNPNKTMKDFPRAENWRIFIDGFRQREGKWAFDSGVSGEKGYYDAMQGSWDRMILTIDTPLSLSEIKNIHDYCLGKGKGQVEVEEVVSDTEYRKDKADFGLVTRQSDPVGGNASLEGTTELFKKILNKDPSIPPFSFSYNNGKILVDYELDPSKSAEENARDYCEKIDKFGGRIIAHGNAEDYIRRYISEYEQDIKSAKTEDEKVLAIAKCVSQIEKVHPFHDGNCRTMLVLTNKLLLQNGLSPCIFQNPNHVDLCSANEIRDEIKKGQKVFQEYSVLNAKNNLESLNPKELKSEKTVEDALLKNISPQPLQAISQLHLLYEQLNKGDIKLQGGSFFSSSKEEKKNIINVMQKLYQDQLVKIQSDMVNLHQEVDSLKGQIESLDQRKLQIQSKVNSLDITPTETAILRLELSAINTQLGVLERKKDRAIKAENWYSKRFDEIEIEHKPFLEKGAGIASHDFDVTQKLAKREKLPMEQASKSTATEVSNAASSPASTQRKGINFSYESKARVSAPPAVARETNPEPQVATKTKPRSNRI